MRVDSIDVGFSLLPSRKCPAATGEIIYNVGYVRTNTIITLCQNQHHHHNRLMSLACTVREIRDVRTDLGDRTRC